MPILKRSRYSAYNFSIAAGVAKGDESDYTGAVLINLSKAYDCLPHDLITAKIEAHGFDSISLKLFQLFFISETKSKNRISYQL